MISIICIAILLQLFIENEVELIYINKKIKEQKERF